MLIRCSYQLSHWCSRIEGQDRWYTYPYRYCLILRWHSVAAHGFQCPSFCVYCTSSGTQVCLYLGIHAAGGVVNQGNYIQTERTPDGRQTAENRMQRYAVPNHHSKPLTQYKHNCGPPLLSSFWQIKQIKFSYAALR